jgi:hypothetical protein
MYSLVGTSASPAGPKLKAFQGLSMFPSSESDRTQLLINQHGWWPDNIASTLAATKASGLTKCVKSGLILIWNITPFHLYFSLRWYIYYKYGANLERTLVSWSACHTNNSYFIVSIAQHGLYSASHLRVAPGKCWFTKRTKVQYICMSYL